MEKKCHFFQGFRMIPERESVLFNDEA